MTEQDILVVKNLQKYFPLKGSFLFGKKGGQVKAVDGVSFTVKRGETLGIVGESGCGKSTLGKTLMRLTEPTSGEVIFGGRDITRLNAKDKRLMYSAIQMIFQDPYSSLNPRMTIGKILEEPLVVRNKYDERKREEIVRQTLKDVGLRQEHYSSYPHEFSGGQRQRIAIARALVSKPNLIVADEAVSALDVSVQAQILNLMQELQQKYMLTYIFISHNLSVIRYISTRIGVMYLGRMMEMATTDEIFNHSLHAYTRGLLEASPRLDRRRVRRETSIIGTDIPSATNPPSGCVFHTRCPYCKPECTMTIPKLKEVEPGHFVACHFAGSY